MSSHDGGNMAPDCDLAQTAGQMAASIDGITMASGCELPRTAAATVASLDGGNMMPVRRPQGEAPPTYGDHGYFFSVELIHGGFFIGSGPDRAYVDGKHAWYDFCHMDSWSLQCVDDIVEDLGYEKAGRVKIYWCLPGKAMHEDGLRQIRSEDDTSNMVSSAIFGHKFLAMYLDHDDSINGYNWDDVIAYPVTQLPAVLSPRKVTYEEAKKNEHRPTFYDDNVQSSSRMDVEDEEESANNSEDSDFALEIVDSDYELDDGDDDLFEDHVDDVANIKGNEVAEPVDDSEDEELQYPNSDDEYVRFNFKSFREENIHNPEFHVGQVFPCVEVLRKAIREYSCKYRVDLTMPINDKARLCVVCAKGCPWRLWASFDSRTKCFMVKKLNDEHTCRKQWQVRAFTSVFLAKRYIELFRADENMNLKNFSRIVQKDWNMTPSRSKLGRARRIAMKEIYGDEIAQYKLLWDYAHEIRRSNPGSSFFLSLDEQGRFRHCYFSFDACKRGFLAACRPVICLDGCHIKTKFGGQLLTAVGIDPNDCIYLVAFAMVEVEDTTTWRWFLTSLKQDLGIVNTEPWTIMSDKQKGLIKAVTELFPQSEHRFCVRHMWQNFQVRFKGDVMRNQLWKIARSSTIVEWEANMEEMKVINQDAYAWLEELPPNTWIRAFQSDLPKCDILLNNNCEVFNKYILEARELPILSMIDKIKSQLMTRIYNKQQEAEKWSGRICPKIMKRVAKNSELSNTCYVSPAGQGIFDVADKETQYIVDIRVKNCTCRRWDLSGLPCSHAIACFRHDRIPPEDMVNSCYSIETFFKAYDNIIMPCKDKKEWQKMNGRPIEPPFYEKKVGRPCKNRRKQPHEVQTNNGKKMTRHGVVIHCSHCGNPGHNKARCSNYKQGLPPKRQIRRKVRAHPKSTEEEDEPVVTQDHNMPWNGHEMPNIQQYGPTLLDVLQNERVQSQRKSTQATPLPDCGFIQAQLENQVPIPPSTATREGSQARKLESMRHEKNMAFAAKKEAALQAKYEATEKKAAEAQARKEAAAKKRAELVEAKKVAAAEKKAHAAEAKKIAAAQKREDATARKEVAAAKRASSAKAREDAHANKKAKNSSVFDYLKS